VTGNASVRHHLGIVLLFDAEMMVVPAAAEMMRSPRRD
jgi:hypothetical protein